MASPVGAILFLLPFTLPIFHSHLPLPFPTSISHFHLPLSFTTPQVATLCPLPYGCYPMAATLWLRVCTPSGQCQVPLLPEPLPDGAPLQCPGQQQLRHSAPANSTSVSPPDEAIAWPGCRCWVANDDAGCPWRSSCKSPRTLQKCKLLITKQLTFGAVLGEHKLSSPSTRLKVNHLCIRCLCFESVRGDLHEATLRFPMPIFPLPEHKNPDFVLGRLSLCAECRATTRR